MNIVEKYLQNVVSVQFTSHFIEGVRMGNCLIYILNEHSVGFICYKLTKCQKCFKYFCCKQKYDCFGGWLCKNIEFSLMRKIFLYTLRQPKTVYYF